MVPGRECGACTVCCTALPIETKELRKLPGVVCEHCRAGGCSIYETRFPICRTYHCGWRTLAVLDDDWRPDRSGVLVPPMNEEGGIEFLMIRGEAAVERRGFVETVAAFVRSEVPSYMAIPGPPGHYSARVPLNNRLAKAAADGDAVRIRAVLIEGSRAASTHSFRKAE